MPYKTILVHLDSSTACDQRVTLGCELARREQAYLIGVAPSGIATPSPKLIGTAPALAAAQKHLDDAATLAAERFKQYCRASGVQTVDARRVSANAIDAVLKQARYSDLVIVGKTNQSAESDETTVPGKGFVEQVLMGSGRPVLVVPTLKTLRPIGERIIFAWDASREAARAATDALPMLQTAKLAEIVVVNANGTTKDSGTELALFLSRHGVSARINQLDGATDVASALLAYAADHSADLIVMGGYGHSRMREWVMGGTTRTILNDTTVPVLMTH